MQNSIFSKKALSILGWALAILVIPAIIPEILLVLWFPVQQAIQLFQDGEAVGLLEGVEEVQPLALEALKAVLPSLGGIAGFVAATAAIRNWRVAQDRQATDLFVKASEMLANESLQVRLAGIYSLERIARNFPNDHWTVMEVLTSLIKEKTSMELLKILQLTSLDHLTDAKKIKSIKADVQLALTVIGRLKVSSPHELRLNMNGTNLTSARLDNTANLDRASLCSVSLSFAQVEGASLVGITCVKSGLQLATFDNVDLRNADLSSSDLSAAIFLQTNLQNAVLTDSKLYEADFRTSSKWLTPEQVKAAKDWQYAFYDPEFVIKLVKHGSYDQKFVEQLRGIALENPEFVKELAKYEPEFAKKLELSTQDSQDQTNEPENPSDTSG